MASVRRTLLVAALAGALLAALVTGCPEAGPESGAAGAGGVAGDGGAGGQGAAGGSGGVAGLGGGGAGGIPLAAIEPPASPAAPQLTPCPPGWREVAPTEPGAPAVCDPWPPGGRAACGAGEAHFPGEPGCAPAGRPCPAGVWPESAPVSGRALHVLPGAAAGGDGSLTRPFAAIAAATGASRAGDTIVLARGVFIEPVVLPDLVTLQGACAADTLVVAPAGPRVPAVVALSGASATVRDLRISGWAPGVRADAGQSLVLDGVAVEDTVEVAVLAAGGTVEASGLVVRRVSSATGSTGAGVAVTGGGTARLSRVAIEEAVGPGLGASEPGSEIEAEQASVSNGRPAGGAAPGAFAEGGARLTLGRGVIDAALDVGIGCSGPGSAVVVEDAWIRGTRPNASTNESGAGLVAVQGASLTATRVRIDGSATAGVAGDAASIGLRHVLVRDVSVRPSDGSAGYGLGLTGGAVADASRLRVERASGPGVIASGSQARLEDLAVLEPAAQEPVGPGVVATDRSAVVIDRAVVERRNLAGVWIRTGSAGELRDLSVRETGPLPDGTYGIGVVVSRGSTATLERVELAGNRYVGLVVSDAGSSAVARHVRIVGTRGRLSDGAHGDGAGAQFGADLELENAEIADSRSTGLFATFAGRVTATGLLVRDTHVAECAGSTCPDRAYGTGVASAVDASLALTWFVVTRAGMCGVQLARGGTADLHHGEVSESPIGVNIQTEGFDLARLQDDVAYRDNEVNLDSALLPVPEPGPLPDGP